MEKVDTEPIIKKLFYCLQIYKKIVSTIYENGVHQFFI